MTDTAESLDPLRLPLTGERLIEASAGTGKTFTIAALYLRLLLGLGGEFAFPRQVSVEELLVVAFTEAATEELRGRIRSNIHELRIACLRDSTDNPLYAGLLAEITDKNQAAQTLHSLECCCLLADFTLPQQKGQFGIVIRPVLLQQCHQPCKAAQTQLGHRTPCKCLPRGCALTDWLNRLQSGIGQFEHHG